LRIACAAAGLILAVRVAAAEPEAGWDVQLEQDGTSAPLVGTMHLRKAPFRIVFTGPANYGYAVITALAPEEFPATLDDRSMATLIRPTNVLIEKGDRSDVSLHVNLPGLIGRDEGSAQLWYEDVANRDFRFQSYLRQPGERAIAVRSISELCTGEGAAWRCQPLDATRIPRLYVIIAGVPPGRLDRFVAPQRVELVLR
jgi:hypothetical protein